MWVLCLNWNRSGAAARSRCPRCWSWNPETSRTEPPQPEPTPAGRGGRHQLKPIPKVKTTTTTWQEANYLNGARTHIKLRTEGEGGESSLQLLIGCRKAASYSRAKIRCRKTKQKQTNKNNLKTKQTKQSDSSQNGWLMTEKFAGFASSWWIHQRAHPQISNNSKNNNTATTTTITTTNKY